ncbi:sulfatase-like hydrolase/transferase [Ruania alkalisoli]|uniref:Sulfatase-like hydrolase/transferase n=1 Tax=Ruania alkalisoli TaxID=2779775 RepID=A0A7M1ST77_9MICO|nr:sulfatase-like hydrolase/transferase [Ruania alkalisoli]QOR70661.1 sulfatase-like hydrolase/transferase [Ruania alkalisoli]
MTSPNILLIVSDQHRWDCAGYAQRCPVRTPTLDALARSGTRFDSAFTPIPLCVPARQSLLTGLRPEYVGGLWNYDLGPKGTQLDPGAMTWSRLLPSRGYRSRYIGKWHVHADADPRDFGYDEYVPLEAYDQRRAHRHPGAHVDGGWFGGIDPVPTEDSRTHWSADRAAEFITRSTRQPWHVRVDFVEPHLPCQPTAEFADQYPAREIPPWGSFAESFAGKPYIQRQQLHSWGVENFTWEDWAPMVSRYYASITQMDAAIGRIMTTIAETGQLEDTLVIYTSDHGDMCGSHRMIDKHHVMYDDVVRVPLVLSWPGTVPAGEINDAFVHNTLDLATLLYRVLGDDGTPTHGAPLVEPDGGRWHVNEALSARDHVVSTYNGQQFGLYVQRMIRDRRWKYIWNPTDVDELYDLHSDPDELDNRIGDSSASAVLAGLRRQLYDDLLADGDRTVDNDWVRTQLLDGRKLAGSVHD